MKPNFPLAIKQLKNGLETYHAVVPSKVRIPAENLIKLLEEYSDYEELKWKYDEAQIYIKEGQKNLALVMSEIEALKQDLENERNNT